MAQADTILIGQATQSLTTEGGFEMKVERYLKGSGQSDVHIFSNAGTCSFSPDVGERYLMFLQGQNYLSTHQCMGSVPLGAGYPHVEAFLAETEALTGAGEIPSQTEEPSSPPRALPDRDNGSAADFPTVPAAAVAVLGPLAFLAGAAFVWRRGG